MKLVNRKKQTFTIIAIVVAILVVIGVVVGIVVSLVKNNEVKIRGIAMNSMPQKVVYYVGDEFDPTGARIQVLANSNNASYFVDENELQFSGFDSSAPNKDLIITVTYQNYTTTFTVEVREMPAAVPVLTSITLSDNFQTTYTLKNWKKYGPSTYGVTIICTYSDGSVKEEPLLSENISGVNLKLESAGETQFKVRYNDGGVIVETIVTVTITN